MSKIYYSVSGTIRLNKDFTNKEEAEKYYDSIVNSCTEAYLMESKPPTPIESGWANFLRKKEYGHTYTEKELRNG